MTTAIPAGTGLVRRWVIVCGTRMVYTNPQHTYATSGEATKRKAAMLAENSKDKLESVFGKPANGTDIADCFGVRECLCAKLDREDRYEPVVYV